MAVPTLGARPGHAPSGGSAVEGPDVVPALPAWPFVAYFVAYPLWWALGVTAFLLPALGAVCLFFLVVRGHVRMPRLWLWWLSFLIWMTASGTMIDTTGRMVGFAQRLGGVIGASLIVLYVHNAPENLPRRRVLAVMAGFLGWMAIGGYLGMAFPWKRITTPMMRVMPDNLASNEYVVELLSPRFSEVQQPWGAPAPFVRPSAPFPYTNAWGHAFVLLLPVVVALAVHATRRVRLLLGALVVLAVPPALATLNRGIFVGVGVGSIYLFLRFARRLSLGRWLQLAAGAGVIGAVVRLSGVLDRVGQRTSTSSTTADRASLYRESFERTLESPWLGWGAPRPSATLDVSVGTQGHFWYLMFSHGFVGLALFCGTLWGLAVVTRHVRDLESVLVHTPVVVIGVMLMFYGIDGVHLVIALSCAMVLQRDRYAPRVPNAAPVPQ